MFYQNRTRITEALYEDRYAFMNISGPFLFRIKNVSEKFVEKITTHILCSIIYIYMCVYIYIYILENRVVYEIMWKNILAPNSHTL